MHSEPSAESAETETIPTLMASASPGSRLGEFALGLFWAAYLPAVILPLSEASILQLILFPFVTLSSIHFLRRAVDSAPRLLVDSEGITDRTSIFGKELRIPWKNIYTVGISGLDGKVRLRVRDLRDLQAGASLGRRIEIFFRRLLGKNVIRISPTLLGITKGDLGRKIQAAHLDFERTQLGLSRMEAIPAPEDLGQAPSSDAPTGG